MRAGSDELRDHPFDGAAALAQLAYEVERLSRITVILIRPGNSISLAIVVAISCEISAALLVVDLPRVDDHPDLTAGAHREHPLDPLWLEAISSRSRRRPTYCSSASPRAPGRAPGDRVGGLDDHRLDRARLDLAVVGLHRVRDGLRLAVAERDLGADQRVRALDLVRDGLADVVQQGAPGGRSRPRRRAPRPSAPPDASTRPDGRARSGRSWCGSGAGRAGAGAPGRDRRRGPRARPSRPPRRSWMSISSRACS